MTAKVIAYLNACTGTDAVSLENVTSFALTNFANTSLRKTQL
jgi:hypothetical protein